MIVEIQAWVGVIFVSSLVYNYSGIISGLAVLISMSFFVLALTTAER